MRNRFKFQTKKDRRKIGRLIRQISRESLKCEGYRDPWNGDYDCGYHAQISCDDCIFCNQGGMRGPLAPWKEEEE